MARIVFIAANEWEPWGGSEELWARTAMLLRQRGAEVHASVKWFGRTPSPLAELAAAGCHVHYRRWPLHKPARHLVVQGVLATAATGYLRNADLVVISQGMNMEGGAWMQACIQRGIPYVVIAHAASESSWIYDGDAERLAEGYNRAELACFVSQANLDLTCRQLGIVMNHAVVVRNPFNVPYDVTLPWPTAERNELRLACVGRLDPRAKGQDLIMGVLSQPQWRERSTHVSLVGTGRAERGLRRLADRYALDSISFPGEVANVVDVWRDHHALLLPSRLEGLPLAAVEAMLCGRPVIATDVGGNAEIITDGETGFLAAAATIPALDAAMTRAWDEREYLRSMGARAASAIRRLVPSDPVESFAIRLEEVVSRAKRVPARSGRQPR